MSASVRTTPRTRSSAKFSSTATPTGSKRTRQASSSSTPGAEFLAGGERFGERREDLLGDVAGHAVEALPGRLAVRAGQTREGLAGAAFAAADEQAGGPSAAFDGRVRGHGAATHAEVEAQIPHDLPGSRLTR